MIRFIKICAIISETIMWQTYEAGILKALDLANATKFQNETETGLCPTLCKYFVLTEVDRFQLR